MVRVVICMIKLGYKQAEKKEQIPAIIIFLLKRIRFLYLL